MAEIDVGGVVINYINTIFQNTLIFIPVKDADYQPLSLLLSIIKFLTTISVIYFFMPSFS